jgi:hypothetical protein
MLNGLVTSLTTTFHLTAIDPLLVVNIDFYRFFLVVCLLQELELSGGIHQLCWSSCYQHRPVLWGRMSGLNPSEFLSMLFCLLYVEF